MAMSSKAYASRPRLPRPISISLMPTILPDLRWSACSGQAAAVSQRSAGGVVGCLDRHLHVVRVALLEPGRRDPDQLAAALEVGDRGGACEAHAGAETADELVGDRCERAAVGDLTLDPLRDQLVVGEHVLLGVAVLAVRLGAVARLHG